MRVVFCLAAYACVLAVALICAFLFANGLPFFGKVLPVKLGEDVDAVSGATITSTVVVEALNGLTK